MTQQETADHTHTQAQDLTHAQTDPLPNDQMIFSKGFTLHNELA